MCLKSYIFNNYRRLNVKKMLKQQNFGIAYPFTSTDFQKFFVDVNNLPKDKVRSEIMHVIFTPKGQRIRMPEFGTDLIKYVFEINDTDSWPLIKQEIMNSVTKYVNNVVLNNIQIMKNEDDASEVYVRIDYSVKEGKKTTNDSIITRL
jgi:phage baseplate assembly protein W